MSNYAFAKESLNSGYEQGKAPSLDGRMLRKSPSHLQCRNSSESKEPPTPRTFCATKQIRSWKEAFLKFSAASYWRGATHLP